MRPALGLVAALLLIAGCDGGVGDAGAATTTAATTTTAEAATTTAPPLDATSAPERECSAAGLSATPEPQPGLPEPVAELRRAIVAAATACDFERLEELALAGDGSLTYSFGETGDAAGHWRSQERSPRRASTSSAASVAMSAIGSASAPTATGCSSWPEIDHQRQAVGLPFSPLRPLSPLPPLPSPPSVGAVTGPSTIDSSS
jgi:hypothetical protein